MLATGTWAYRGDKDGTIARKHGNTLIGTLCRTYGQNFAGGVADTEKLARNPCIVTARGTRPLIEKARFRPGRPPRGRCLVPGRLIMLPM